MLIFTTSLVHDRIKLRFPVSACMKRQRLACSQHRDDDRNAVKLMRHKGVVPLPRDLHINRPFDRVRGCQWTSCHEH